MAATTLEPITAEENNTDHHATSQRSAGKPPGINADVIFTHSSHLNIVTDVQTTQQRVQDPASKLPRPQSSQAFVGCEETSLIRGGSTPQIYPPIDARGCPPRL